MCARSLSGLLTCAVSLLAVGAGTRLAADINPGDIMVIGFHADPEDEFAWVTLVDLRAGEEIFFSDAGWFSGGFGGANTTSDGGLKFTVPSGGLAAGTVLTVSLERGVIPPGYDSVGGPLGPEMLAGRFGDQLVVFTGSIASPTFIFALNTNSSQWGVNSPPNFAAESELYPGLVDGVTAVAVGAGDNPGQEYDNSFYFGPSSGSREEIQAAVADSGNWQSDDNPLEDITNGTAESGFRILSGSLFRRGDTNEDGEQDISDAVTIFAFLFLGGVEISCDDAADTNDDGEVDVSDGIFLLGFLFLGDDPPNSPFEECGSDPTDDGLLCETFTACP